MTAVAQAARAMPMRTRAARRRVLRRLGAVAGLVAALLAAFAVALMVGDTVYTPSEVVRVILGQTVPGASFTVGDLRLPRASMAVLAGAAFGIGGATFQTMLRNPLASPDVIGISSGASAAAVVGIVLLGLGPAEVSVLAVVAALGVAAGIHRLSSRDGVVGTRLILIGIGVEAMLGSVVSGVLVRAASWDLQTAMRWLTGSVNGATWDRMAPLAVAVVVGVPLLLTRARRIDLLQHGDDAAAALGAAPERTRRFAILVAVVLIAFATAASGPIAFVAFLAGPIAARVVGPGVPLLLPAALTGALLVLVADLIGQSAFDTRYPVGVVTGALGAPFLIWLLVRTNRSGGSL